jgi:hypothetical protein
MQSLQDASKPAVECHPPATRNANLETGSVIEMSGMQEGALCAAREDDQADRTTADYALQVGTSERGTIASLNGVELH